MADPQTHYRICPLCEACCGLEIKTQADKVISIRGAAQDVFSRGYICPKGVSLKDLHEDPDRLRTPLVKNSAGVFVEASWDAAFAEIERRLLPVLQAHGPDAIGLVVGNPSAHKISLLSYFPRLARAIGTRNVFSASTLDQMPKQLSSGLLFGHWLSIPVPDIERCDYLLILGANPMVSNGSLWTVPDYRGKAKAMRERGGKIVVVDPRRSETAAHADQYLPIKPGGDVFLLLGIAHALLTKVSSSWAALPSTPMAWAKCELPSCPTPPSAWPSAVASMRAQSANSHASWLPPRALPSTAASALVRSASARSTAGWSM